MTVEINVSYVIGLLLTILFALIGWFARNSYIDVKNKIKELEKDLGTKIGRDDCDKCDKTRKEQIQEMRDDVRDTKTNVITVLKEFGEKSVMVITEVQNFNKNVKEAVREAVKEVMR